MTLKSVPADPTAEAMAAKMGRRLAVDLSQNTEGVERDHALITDAVIDSGRHWSTTATATMDLRKYIAKGRGEAAANEAARDAALDAIPTEVLIAQAEETYARDDHGEAERLLPADQIERYEREDER